jgi:flagellar basal-body rod protein FlgF
MSAAAARAAQLDSVADNLANAESPGFKAARPAFQSFLPGGGRSDKVLAAAVATGTDMRPGTTTPTGGPLDVVPEGELFLGVRSATGSPAYTRNGKIDVGPAGELLVAGRPLLGNTGEPLTVPQGAAPTIGDNGEVMVDGESVGSVALYKLDGPVDRLGNGLFAPGRGGSAQMTEGLLRVGELELGNAPALESAVQMISAQRQFETAMQAIQTYRRMDERATEVGRVR